MIPGTVKPALPPVARACAGGVVTKPPVAKPARPTLGKTVLNNILAPDIAASPMSSPAGPLAPVAFDSINFDTIPTNFSTLSEVLPLPSLPSLSSAATLSFFTPASFFVSSALLFSFSSNL